MKSKDPSLGPGRAVPDLRQRTVIGVFEQREKAEAAYQDLREAGVPTDDISVIHKPEGGRPEFGVEQTQTGKTTAAATGAGLVIGGIVGAALLAVPGVGPLLAAGPITLVLGGIGIGGSLGALLGSIVGLGVPTEQAKAYEQAIRDGGVFIAVRAAEGQMVHDVCRLLRQHGAQHLADFMAAA